MSLRAEVSPDNTDKLIVSVPPTRPDILHQCDIVEDAAIAYGFNNLPHTFPATSTVAQPLAVSKLSDIIRHEWAYAGWVEVLPLILVRRLLSLSLFLHPQSRTRVSVQCSHEENFAWLNTPDDHQTAVKIANPKTLEFQVVRTSLLQGLLKTIRENRSHALPLRIFETSDVVFKDPTRERQSRNVRHAAAVWCNKTAGFEIVHGLLDRAMAMLEVPHIPGGRSSTVPTGYYIKERTGAYIQLTGKCKVIDDELPPTIQTRRSSLVVRRRYFIARGRQPKRRSPERTRVDGRRRTCRLASWVYYTQACSRNSRSGIRARRSSSRSSHSRRRCRRCGQTMMPSLVPQRKLEITEEAE